MYSNFTFGKWVHLLNKGEGGDKSEGERLRHGCWEDGRP